MSRGRGVRLLRPLFWLQNRLDAGAAAGVPYFTYFLVIFPPLRAGVGAGMDAMDRYGWKPLVGVLLIALILRVVAAAAWHSRVGEGFFFGDSASYWSLGRAVAAGEPYRYGPDDAAVFRAPGYPILLAPMFRLAGPDASPAWGRAEGVLLGTGAVAALWWFGRVLFDDRTALLAAAIGAVYPGAIVMSAMVLTETPFALVMLLQMAVGVVAWRSQSVGPVVGWAILSGALGGLATLVRPSWLLFTPLAAGALGFSALIGRGARGQSGSVEWGTHAHTTTRPSPWRRPIAAALMVLGLLLAMIPWWARNATVTGRFVPTTLQVGASLYDGLSPTATGASDMQFVERFRAAERRTPSPVPLEPRLDRRMRRAALEWAREHPADALRLAGVKFARMWNVWPNEPSFDRWPVRLVMLVTYLPVMALGLWGAIRTAGRGWAYWLCWMPAVYLTLLHVVFVSSIRYRQPAMFGLMLLAAAVITGAGRRIAGPTSGHQTGGPSR